VQRDAAVIEAYLGAGIAATAEARVLEIRACACAYGASSP